jgi:outer membrane protein OmpA-like peptidoglycan-associated protein
MSTGGQGRVPARPVGNPGSPVRIPVRRAARRDTPRLTGLRVEAPDTPRLVSLRIEAADTPRLVNLRVEAPDTPRLTNLRIEPASAHTAALAELDGMHFEFDKTFLLPSAMNGIAVVKDFWRESPHRTALLVGHTDQIGAASYNQQLSLERAKSVDAFLRDDVPAWSAHFAAGRWHYREFQHMLSALPGDAPTKFYEGPVTGNNDMKTLLAVKAFQAWSNRTRGTSLPIDGDPNRPATRDALIAAYMDLDGTTLPKDMEPSLHGCGPFHPLAPGLDEVSRAKNRRVEIFLFDGPIDPPIAPCDPPGGCASYARWREAVGEEIDLEKPAAPA